MKIKQIKAIDVHGHFGNYLIQNWIYKNIMTALFLIKILRKPE